MMTMCMPILGLAQDVLIRDAIVTPYLWLKAAENLFKGLVRTQFTQEYSAKLLTTTYLKERDNKILKIKDIMLHFLRDTMEK